jgi:hypothetical protein
MGEKRGKGRSVGPAAGAVRPNRTGMAWTVIAIGVVPLGFGLWGLKQGFETRNWPRVEAEIVDRTLAIRESPRDRRSERRGTTVIGDTGEFAAFSVVFRYTIAGETHFAGGVERGDLGLQNSAKSRELNEAHPVGSKTMVVVDPDDPDDAYLVAGPSSAAKMLSGVGAGMVLIGLWMRSLMRRGIGTGTPVDE